jgi:hypothetical protein
MDVDAVFFKSASKVSTFRAFSLKTNKSSHFASEPDFDLHQLHNLSEHSHAKPFEISLAANPMFAQHSRFALLSSSILLMHLAAHSRPALVNYNYA